MSSSSLRHPGLCEQGSEDARRLLLFVKWQDVWVLTLLSHLHIHDIIFVGV